MTHHVALLDRHDLTGINRHVKARVTLDDVSPDGGYLQMSNLLVCVLVTAGSLVSPQGTSMPHIHIRGLPQLAPTCTNPEMMQEDISAQPKFFEHGR